jgi:ribonuclease HI
MDKSEPVVTIFTDGACSGNPGPGGWAALLMLRDTARFISGYEPRTTNNRMELLAAIAGLKVLTRSTAAAVHTDSKYLRDGIERWIHSWRQNNWLTYNKKPVVSQDLWIELSELAALHQVRWIWVRGHADSPYNNFVDLLARVAIAMKSGLDIKLPLRELEEFLPQQTPSSRYGYDARPILRKLGELLHGRQIPWKD